MSLGYIVLTNEYDLGWNDDWDGVVHPTLKAARESAAECRAAGYRTALAHLEPIDVDPKVRAS